MSSTPRPAVAWADGAVEIVDQTRLPAEEVVVRLETPEAVVDAIRRLAVRGAPAIGLCGALGVVLAAGEPGPLAERAAAIAAARPTAVNLRWAVDRVVAATRAAGSPGEARALAEREALVILAEDAQASRRLGEAGRAELAGATRILTHCNAGRLAASGWGTALATVYAKAAAGEPVEVLACETRPLLQGARLTAWELARAGIPVRVLVDAAAAAAMAAGRVDAVLVGCDRVAANGDAANKIGTYALALAARAHGIPFYVAGPVSTLDVETPTGAEIVVEERDGAEIRVASGLPDEVEVWNPAFDVTPAELITALITDRGVVRAPFGVGIGRVLALSPVGV